MRLKDQVAVVTGAGRNIGEDVAKLFVEEGAKVAVVDLDPGRGSTVASQINAKNSGKAISVVCDVSSPASVESMVQTVVKQFGGIDILVNNAARHHFDVNVPPTQLEPAKWRQILDVNIMGTVNCTTLAVPEMRKRGSGAILNLSSVAGYEVTTCYGVTKLAIRGLTTAMAGELAADNIRVNAIAPGFMDSDTVLNDVPQAVADMFIQDLQLIKRQGRMTELVGAARLLCSDEGSFITGETIIIGGGAFRQV